MTTPPNSIELGGKTYTVERPTGLKASRAMALMRALSKAMPELSDALARFRRDYERENVLELDRVQARMRYPDQPLVRDGEPILDNGELVMVPSPVDRLSEEDWASAGGVYRVPASPSTMEVVAALFDRALEVAESHVYRLVALFTIPNDELKALRRAGDGALDGALVARAEELLDDAFADELLELAVIVGETVDHHFTRKTRALGDRVGNALRLIGLEGTAKKSPTPRTDGPESSTPTSSTDSDENTDGPPTSPSTPPTTSSPASETDLTATPPRPSSSDSETAQEERAPAPA